MAEPASSKLLATKNPVLPKKFVTFDDDWKYSIFLIPIIKNSNVKKVNPIIK